MAARSEIGDLSAGKTYRGGQKLYSWQGAIAASFWPDFPRRNRVEC